MGEAVLTGNEANDPEIIRLTQQVQRANLAETREYLRRTQREQDWQDRCYLLNVLAPFLRAETLVDAIAAEPDAPDLSLLWGVYCFEQAGKSRGSKSAEETSEVQFQGAAEAVHAMMDALTKAYTLEPGDPTPRIFAMRGLIVFSDYQKYVRQEYDAALCLAPDCVPAQFAMVNARALKWGGSHTEALQIARAAQRLAKPGSDLAACLFYAHFLVWQYARVFDKNKPEADKYLRDPGVAQELNAALSRWLDGSYRPRRSSMRYLHEAALWYYLSGDNARLRQVFALIGTASCDSVWQQIGNPAKVHAAALQLTTAPPAPLKKTGLFGWLKK